MTEPEEGVRLVPTEPAPHATVPPPTDIRMWRPERRNVRALDRHIASRYGPEYVRGWAA